MARSLLRYEGVYTVIGEDAAVAFKGNTPQEISLQHL